MSEHVTSRRSALLGSGTLGLAAALGTSAAAQDKAKRPDSEFGSEPSNHPVSPVDRAFVRIAEGLVHYRYMDRRGDAPAVPIMMCHASPGSSKRYESLIEGLAENRFVFAPDTLGNGDSPPPAYRKTEIAYYVDTMVRVMDGLNVGQVDFYGAHTGAHIGCELAVRHPDRVRRLIMDGIALYTPEFKKEALLRYAPEVKPDRWGGHLAWAWNRAIEGSQYWPHYMRDEAHRLPPSDPTAEQLHSGVMYTLNALDTYHIAYGAAFRHDAHSALPRITQPTLAMSIKRDPLHVFLDEAAAMIPGAKRILLESNAGQAGKLAVIRDFFAG